jgi:hypothetical protein
LILISLLLFCGSEPAREGGLTADLLLEGVRDPIVGAAEGCDLLILILLLLFCGSEPARDDGGTFKFNLEDLPLSRAGSFRPGFVH